MVIHNHRLKINTNTTKEAILANYLQWYRRLAAYL